MRQPLGYSPLQLYTVGMVTLKKDNAAALDYFAPVDEEYGTEINENLYPDSTSHVNVPNITPTTTANLD